MVENRKSDVKGIQELISLLVIDERRYLSDPGNVYSAILNNPNKDHKEIMAELLENATARSSAILEELNLLLHEVDSLATLGQLVYLDSRRRNSTTSSESFGSDAVIEFVGGIVTSFNPIEVIANIGKEFNPRKLIEIDKLLREFANLQNTIRLGERLVRKPSEIGMAQLLLTMEAQFNRSQGYSQHLERIYRRIFEPISDMIFERFDFHPSLIFDLVKQQTHYLEEKYLSKRIEIDEVLANPASRAGIPESEFRLLAAMYVLVGSAPSIDPDLEERLARQTGASLDEVKAAVTTLCTDLGAQSEVRRLSDPLLIRNRPIIRIPDGRFLWLRPVDFPHEVLNWFHELVSTDEMIKAAYDKSRQEVTPKLTHEILAKVFGQERSFLEPVYLSEGLPDLDVLITPPASAILVEVKAVQFTWQGRAALGKRVEKKIDELLIVPIEQLSRAEESISRAPETWKSKGRKKLGLVAPNEVVKISVTLENIDPISTWAQEKNMRVHVENSNVWPVCLVDLMMVADILKTPHEFYSYAFDRAKLFQNGNPLINMESDILSHWCSERLTNIDFSTDEIRVLSFCSEDLNEYFIYQPLGFDLDPPTSHVPDLVLRALDKMYLENDGSWFECVHGVLAAGKEDWAKAKRSLDLLVSKQSKSARERKRVKRLLGGIEVGENFVLYVSDSFLAEIGPKAAGLPALYLQFVEGTIQAVMWRATA